MNINAYHHQVFKQETRCGCHHAKSNQNLSYLAQNTAKSFYRQKKLPERWVCSDQAETVFKLCEHLAANPDRGISKVVLNHLHFFSGHRRAMFDFPKNTIVVMPGMLVLRPQLASPPGWTVAKHCCESIRDTIGRDKSWNPAIMDWLEGHFYERLMPEVK